MHWIFIWSTSHARSGLLWGSRLYNACLRVHFLLLYNEQHFFTRNCLFCRWIHSSCGNLSSKYNDSCVCNNRSYPWLCLLFMIDESSSFWKHKGVSTGYVYRFKSTRDLCLSSPYHLYNLTWGIPCRSYRCYPLTRNGSPLPRTLKYPQRGFRRYLWYPILL